MRKLLLAAVAGTAFALAGCSETKAPEAAPTEATESEAAPDASASAAEPEASAPAAEASSEAPKM